MRRSVKIAGRRRFGDWSALRASASQRHGEAIVPTFIDPARVHGASFNVRVLLGVARADRSFAPFSFLPEIFHFGERGLIGASATLRQ